MTPIVTLLALVAGAYLVSFALSRQQRQGYGLVSGAEFLAVGMAVGPSVLGFLSPALLDAASPALAAAIGWLGFRLGLRLRKGAWMAERRAVLLLVEPLVSAGLLFLLLTGADAMLELSLSAGTRWALAAVGAPSTKSGLLWVVGRHGARGPLTERLLSVTRLDDLAGVLLLGVLFSASSGSTDALEPWVKGAATLLVGPLLAVLAALLIGRGQLREDLAWVAVLGLSGLGTGLALRLGLSSFTVAALFGATLGLSSPHAERIEQMTSPTERPIVQVLLLLVGAQLALEARMVFVAALYAALRIVAKIAGGASLRLVPWAPRTDLWHGTGLLASGGMVTAMVLSVAQGFPPRAQPVLWGFVLCSVIGDLLGSRALVTLLRRNGELDAKPAVSPLELEESP